jgi:hypothetical protein
MENDKLEYLLWEIFDAKNLGYGRRGFSRIASV